MKKYILLVASILFLSSSIAVAHPSSEIKMSFDHSKKTLDLMIRHTVKDRAKHYIKTVVVYLNNTKIIEQDCSIQTSSIFQHLAYIIPDATIEDEITVETTCSIYGQQKVTNKVNDILEEGL